MADQITAYQAYRNRVVEGSIPSLGTTVFFSVKKGKAQGQKVTFQGTTPKVRLPLMDFEFNFVRKFCHCLIQEIFKFKKNKT